MSEQDQGTTTGSESSSESGQTEENLSLDDLYGEFQPQQTQPAQSTQQQQPSQQGTGQGSETQVSYDVPDPVNDPEGFKQYQANVHKELAAVRSEAQSIQQQLQEKEQALSAQAEERDFQNVAEEIAKQAEVDTDLVEAGLLHRYIKDKNFQQIWQNRQANPQAFKKVKSVLSKEMRSKFAMKVDPQIAENQRAAEEADKGATAQRKEEESVEDQLMKADSRDFDRMLRKLRGDGSL